MATSSPFTVPLAAGIAYGLYKLLDTRRRHRTSLSDTTHAALVHENWVSVVRKAIFEKIPRPHHSEFLVAAALVYEDESGAVRHVTGCNSEVCSVNGSICAERCCLVKLRSIEQKPVRILAVYITATADSIITPGLLCREFLSEMASPDMLVVMFTPDWRPMSDGQSPVGQLVVHRLGGLFPHACIYRGVRRAELLPKAQAFSQSMQGVTASTLQSILPSSGVPLTPSAGQPQAQVPQAAAVSRLYQQVLDMARQAGPPSQDSLYPIHYAAAVLFSDGSSAVARMDLCLEYGCSIDAVAKLSHAITQAAGRQARPVVLLHSDQFGILHAPFAAPRSWLCEWGHGDTTVVLHNGTTGELEAVKAETLAPAAPAISL